MAGLFIRERMFRVARELPMAVVSPVTWFPLQNVIRRWRPHFRLTRARSTEEDGIAILRPRYLSVPGPIVLDGLGMAAGAWADVRRLVRAGGAPVIDAHFAYPDGFAASLLAARLGVPYTVTLRGTEVRHSRMRLVRRQLRTALAGAQRVFTVSESLRRLAIDLGAAVQRTMVVPNGVDIERFRPVPRAAARHDLGIPPQARVLLTVGGMVTRKGFQRVIERLPALRQQFGEVLYLAVGGGSREGDDTEMFRALARRCGVEAHVRFVGPVPPSGLNIYYSAADVFVLASANEGWANVLLEAMACGTPVVASDVGGNREVVAGPDVGIVFDLADGAALDDAFGRALRHPWDRDRIVAYAARNSWQACADRLVAEFRGVARDWYTAGAAVTSAAP